MPTQPHPLALIDAALALTRQQAEAAAAGDWARVDDLLDRRAPLAARLATLTPAGLDPAARGRACTALAAMLDLDRWISARARATRADLRRELNAMQRARRTLTAYTTPAGADAARFIDRSR